MEQIVWKSGEREFVWGSEEQYNRVRCGVVAAANSYTNGTDPELTRWLSSSTQINFAALPWAYDSARLDRIMRIGIGGVYWLVYKYHDRGNYTVGQALDMRDTIKLLHQVSALQWDAEDYKRFVMFMDESVSHGEHIAITKRKIDDAPTISTEEAVKRLKSILSRKKDI